MPSCSLPGPPRPRTPAYGPTRCSASHARARPRSSSSSAPKLNSTPLPLWSGPVRVYALGRSLAAAALAMASSCASIGIGSVPTVPGRKSAIFSGVQAPSAWPARSSRGCAQTAIFGPHDRVDLPGDVLGPGPVAEQVGDERGHVLGLADLLELHGDVRGHAGAGDGCDGVGGDPVLGQAQRGGADERDDPALGRAVVGLGDGALVVAAGEADQGARALLGA